jgi:hypothetical protein
MAYRGGERVKFPNVGNNYLPIFDATVMPPGLKTSVKVRDEPGWITFGIDGRTGRIV